jgi:hypothetical protein
LHAQGAGADKRRAQGTAGSERNANEAAALAERMRPVMAQLAGLSAHKAAAELNRRKIASATGGKVRGDGDQAAGPARSVRTGRALSAGAAAEEADGLGVSMA